MLVFTDPTGSGCALSPSLPADGAERAHFHRIAKRRAGAVRLDIADVGRLHARIAERCADHRFLRRAVRHGQAAAAAILIDRGAANHREHAVASGHGIRQPLEHDHAAPSPRT